MSLLEAEASASHRKKLLFRSAGRIPGDLCDAVIEYCLIQSRVSLAAEALDVLTEAKREGKTEFDPYFQQRMGMVLSKKRSYNIDKYPEFLIYEYATGRMLQPAQVEILSWIIERIETASQERCAISWSSLRQAAARRR